ncbi:MAG: hypothetical protein BWY67_01480 [Bacteroidetes bacterium ADurb.Bin397]|nr:MAG: hypothetical protein BWY67_01480 [Bacteroidetes bacterium ADurb.Bin397]
MAGVYPNPATDKLNIVAGDQELTSITIFDASGRIVYESKAMVAAGRSEVVNIRAFSSGVYAVKIQSASQTVTRKFVKQ